MMVILLLLLLLPLKIYSQDADTLAADTAGVIIDSLSVANDTTAVSDTTGLLSTEKNIAKVDALIPLYSTPISRKSFFLNKNDFYWNDYRYAGNIVNDLPFTFLFDRGFIGYPSPVSYYGFTNGDLSILKDGVLLNNRQSGTYDLNNLQSEYIDSIEASPLVRGFLYGPYMNPTAINIITKDFLSIAPYSRIKYYEGAFGEAFIDGIFNLLIFERFNLFVDVTNRKFDSSYTNTDISIWQGTVKGKHLFSNKINLIAEYNIVDNQHGLNYGVDVDSILQAGNDLITTFYDELTAPVNSYTGRENIKQHNFSLRMLGKYYKEFETDLTFYSRFNQDEHDYYLENIRYQTKRKINSKGISLNQTASFDLIDFALLTGYEQNSFELETLDTDYNQSETDFSFFTISPIATLNLLNGNLKPSVFFRYSSETISDYSTNRTGIGADLKYIINEMFNIYAGYSSVELFNDKRFDIIEGGADFNSDIIDASIKVFKSSDYISPRQYGFYLENIFIKEYTGVNLKFAFDLWFMLLEANGTLYDKKNMDDLFSIPKQTLNAGIFYKDILFSENLNLKTGFTFNYASGFNHAIQNVRLFQNYDSFMRINFTLIGLIQNRARIYFTMENLLGENYFIVPFYPMRERNIRFGLAWELLN